MAGAWPLAIVSIRSTKALFGRAERGRDLGPGRERARVVLHHLSHHPETAGGRGRGAGHSAEIRDEGGQLGGVPSLGDGAGLTEQGRRAQVLASAVHAVGRPPRRSVARHRRHGLAREKMAQLLVAVARGELTEAVAVPAFGEIRLCSVAVTPEGEPR